MDDSHDTKKYTALSWIFSIFLHSSLGVLLWFMTVDMTPETPEFVMVTISSLNPSDIRDISRVPPPLPFAASLQSSFQQEDTRIVDLPERRMLEREMDKIPLDIKDKLQVQESIQSTITKLDPLRGINTDARVQGEIPLPGERRQIGSRRTDVGVKTSAIIPTAGSAGDTGKKPYEIQWEGGAREVLAGPLPVFPDNVAKEVVLKFRIEVSPQGTVKDATPLQKGDATLESITKQALKQWLFNSLEKSAPQVSQFGTITFRFVLK